MNSYVSIHTLNLFDSIIQSYKINILKDFYETCLKKDIKNKVTYQEFENIFLHRNKSYKFLNKCNEINKNLCHAYIWNKDYGKIQCQHNKKYNLFCGKHKLNQNYGIIE